MNRRRFFRKCVGFSLLPILFGKVGSKRSGVKFIAPIEDVKTITVSLWVHVVEVYDAEKSITSTYKDGMLVSIKGGKNPDHILAIKDTSWTFSYWELKEAVG